MRVRVLKRQNSSYVELPPDIAKQDELELFELKPGYYLLSVPLGSEPGALKTAQSPEQNLQNQKARQNPPMPELLSGPERSVIKKLLSIRFDQRIPSNVAKLFNEDEKSILRELQRRGLVNVFKSLKYKDGVYNIKDSAFTLAQKGAEEGGRGTGSSATQAQPSDLVAILKTRGFIVMNDRNQARALSESLSQEMKSGAITGVKGFDNKFYVVTRQYLASAQIAVGKALKEDMDAATVAAEAKLDPEGCMAVLRILSEAGEILEKKRGVFAPV
jgi:hypothetical protein